MLTVDLFAGIGGFALSAEAVGWTPAVSCEINPFGRKVLEYYWPNAYHHTDIHTLTGEKINEEIKNRFGRHSGNIVLTGGFPCQPYSTAGKRLGKEDERHLWPEMLRIIRELRPRYIVGENVAGIVSWNGGLVFEEVQTDLEAEGYEVQSVILPACAVNAPHRRDRVWFVAHRLGKSTERKRRKATNQGRQADGGKPTRIRQDYRQACASGIDAISPQRPTPNADSDGHELRGLGKDRQAESEGEGNKFGGKRIRQDDRGTRKQGPTSNPRHPKPQGRDETAQGQQHAGRRSARGKFAPFGISQVVANTAGTGRKERKQSRFGKDCPQDEAGLHNRLERFGSDGRFANQSQADAENRNRPKGQVSGAMVESAAKNLADWTRFPTVEPAVHRGNDGLSARLAGITVSRHRRESIKAYGNAIVPQVAVEIFRAIIEAEGRMKDAH